MEYEHIPRLVDVAQRIVDTFDPEGGISFKKKWEWKPGAPNYKRVLILLPQRYFKSETFSRLLSAYFLYRFPERTVGLTSYGAQLAWDLSQNARDYYKAIGGDVSPESDAKKQWKTTKGGGMWADGMGGTILGFGYDLGIGDDWMKPKHARSRAYIETFREWYPSTWYNRQEPGAAMLNVMQRLGQQDPIDLLYRREVGDETDEAPEYWHIVCCDEIKSREPLAKYDGPQGLPETCTLEPDPRKEGEILSPSRFSLKEVKRQQRAAGVYRDAQRQQRPGKPSGDFWRVHWFGTYGTEGGDPYEELPAGTYNKGRDWDTAYTKNEANSATAQIETCRGPGEDRFPVYITDVDWRWYEAPERLAWIKRLSGPHYIEAKATGKSDAQQLSRAGIDVKEVSVQGGDKYARSGDIQPDVSTDDEEGKRLYEPRVLIHASLYEKLLNDERQGLLTVTAERLLDGGPDLDVNDVFVQAMNRHSVEEGWLLA